MEPAKVIRLNPFEVREVLQANFNLPMAACKGLNPFEVREVLQVLERQLTTCHVVSIPLKSGRCCKRNSRQSLRLTSLNPFEVREVLQARKIWFMKHYPRVSIPLKSGRCCKVSPSTVIHSHRSQSL